MAPAKSYDMTVYPVQVAVRSQSDGAAVHMVTLPYCDCADFTNRKGQAVETDAAPAITVCKHLLAALGRVGGWHRPAPQIHAGIQASAAHDYLVNAEVSVDLASTALANVVHGQPATIPAQGKRGEIRIEVVRERNPRLYTVTIPG
jgi:hypothetical protein